MPPVQTIHNHAYVSLHDIIADFLLHSDATVDPICRWEDTMNRGSTLARCRQACEQQQKYETGVGVLDKQLTHLAISEWSDDFEGNASIRSDRTSLWIKTVTVTTKSGMDSCDNTYIVALGEKHTDHEPVESAFATSLKELCDPTKPVLFFFGTDKCVHYVAVHLIVSLSDQPERRSANHVRAGNSNNLRRWGWRTDLSTLERDLPACKSCLKKNIELDLSSPTHTGLVDNCLDCLDWSLATGRGAHDNDLRLYYDLPKHFPLSESEGGSAIEQVLKSQPLTYLALCKQVNKAFVRVSEGRWDTKTGRAFLSAMGVDEHYGNQVLCNAENVYLLNVAALAQQDEPDDYQAFLTERQHEPSKFTQPPLPSLWTRGQELMQHVDCPMHLLFLGVVRKILKIQTEWASARKVLPTFVTLATAALDDVYQLQLPWCRVLPVNVGGYSGWVSENYVGVCRIFQWYTSFFFVARVDETPDPPDPVTLPDDNQMPWKTAQCDQWYATHRVPRAERRRLVHEKRVHIRQLMESPNCPPRRSQAPTRLLLLLLSRLTQMVVACVMSEGGSNRSLQVRRIVKVFLSVCSVYDTRWQTYQELSGKHIPFWISCYNFCSLLNLPDIIDKYGSLRLLWEGGFRGEKILTQVKPLVTRGTARGFREGIVKSFYTQKVFARFSSRMEKNNKQTRMNQFGKVYGSVRDIRQKMLAGKPIVVVWYKNGPVGCIVQGPRKGNTTTQRIVPLAVALHVGWWILNGATYWRWQYPSEDDTMELPTTEVVEETIFLPFVFDGHAPDMIQRGEPTNEETGLARMAWGEVSIVDDIIPVGEGNGKGYCTISSSWSELNRSFRFAIPAIDDTVVADIHNCGIGIVE